MRERLLFVGLLIAAAATVPLIASLLRSRLRSSLRARDPSRERRVLVPVRYGYSPRSRRSPRHAVLLHRGLLGAVFMAVLALCLILAATALPALGVAVIPAAFAFALPTLLVTLHTRRRGLRE